MRVLYFLESFGLGGIESFILNVLEFASGSENEIECCAGRMTTRAFDLRIENLDVPFHCLGNEEDGFPGLRYEKCAKKLEAFLSENHYDIFHIHANHGVDYLFARVAKKCGVPCVVIHSHNTGVTEGAYKAIGHRMFRRAFHSFVDGYFACSADAAKWLIPAEIFSRGDYVFVPNGIDLELYGYSESDRYVVREELGLKGKCVCGHIGRFNYQKNHEFLIDVFDAVHKRRPDTVLLLVGEGELREKIENKVKSLGLNDEVLFLGPRNDVPALLSAFDVLLFPSRFEGLSVVLVEAQAADLPILASDAISLDSVLSDRVELFPYEVSSWVSGFDNLPNCSKRGRKTDSRLDAFSVGHSIELMDGAYRRICEMAVTR